jgi:UDP-2,3-diacylglucosamine pyrophosphatase LpxH
LDFVRRRLGLRDLSRSEWNKRNVKQVLAHISRFETHLLSEAKTYGTKSVICGHIHHAVDRDIDGMRYLNSGDWVETCSGIVYYPDGRFELVRWDLADHKQHRKSAFQYLQTVQTNDAAGGTCRTGYCPPFPVTDM